MKRSTIIKLIIAVIVIALVAHIIGSMGSDIVVMAQKHMGIK